MFGQVQAQLHAAQHDLRKQSGNQDSRQQAGQHHEQQIVAGVERGQRDDENSAEVNDAFARHAVIDPIGEPAQGVRRASTGTIVKATQPASASAPSAENAAAEVRPSSAAAPEYSASSSAPPSATMAMTKLRQLGRSRPCSAPGVPSLARRRGAWHESVEAIAVHQSGTGVDSIISRRMASACADFFLRGGVARVDHHAVRENRAGPAA